MLKLKLELKSDSAPETRDFPFEICTESVTDDGRFEGYGAVFGGEPDSYGDIIAPGAFHQSIKEGGRNKTGIAMLWQHDPSLPIGTWDEVREDAKGLFMRGTVDKEAKPNGIPVYSMLKRGAVKGLSIGFRTIKSERDETTSLRTLKEIELWEVSPVTFPAAVRAQVTAVKAIEGAKTPRELEKSLRDAGLSISAAKYLVSLCKGSLVRREATPNNVDLQILTELRKANLSLQVFKAVNFN